MTDNIHWYNIVGSKGMLLMIGSQNRQTLELTAVLAGHQMDKFLKYKDKQYKNVRLIKLLL